MPILRGVTGHNDVVTKKVFIEGVLSEIVDEITQIELKKEALTSGARSNVDPDQVGIINGEISALNERKASRESTLMRADNLFRKEGVLLHSLSGDPNIMVRRVIQTSSSDPDVVTRLDIWRHMVVTFAGSALKLG